eukprot:COSAG02_NODE_129_length_34796_cov_26.576015_2_plen_51_part_00
MAIVKEQRNKIEGPFTVEFNEEICGTVSAGDLAMVLELLNAAWSRLRLLN